MVDNPPRGDGERYGADGEVFALSGGGIVCEKSCARQLERL
jgi:hypothetical protein